MKKPLILSKINQVQSKSYFYPLIIPLLLVILNFILKIRFVSWTSLAMDEPFSVYFSQFNYRTIIEELSRGNNPPFYELLLHLWINIFGISEFAVRFPSVLFSSLTVYFIYRICYEFFDVKTAAVASILFTFSNYQLYFAQEARVYPLFMLLTTVSMYQYMQLLTTRYSKVNSTTYVIVNVLLLYSHFFSWFVLFIQVFVLIIIYRKKAKILLRFSKYLIFILLCYLPYVKIFVVRFLDSSKGTWLEPVTDLRQLHTLFNSLLNETHGGYVIVLILLLVLLRRYIVRSFNNKYVKVAFLALSVLVFFISLSFRLPSVLTTFIPHSLLPLENNFSRPIFIIMFLGVCVVMFIHFLLNRIEPNNEKVVISWFFIPCFIMFTSSFSIPMFIDRYLMFCTPAFFIILSLMVNKLGRNLFFGSSLMLITLMTVSFTPLKDNNRDVKTLVSKVKELQKGANSAVFICPDNFALNFSYYYNRDYFRATENSMPKKEMLDALHSDNVFPVKNDKELESIIDMKNYDRIIYIDAAADFSYPDNNIKSYLKKNFQKNSVAVDSCHIRSIFNLYSYVFR